MKIKDIAIVMESLAPERLAEIDDPIGLQVGNSDADVRTVLVALDPSRGVLNEAAERNAQLVVSHHPLIFTPLASLTDRTPAERRAVEFVKQDVALFAAHTNLDCAPGGINDSLAQLLGISYVQPLTRARTALKKIVVFVPAGDLDDVAAAMCAAGAGSIGAYTDCTFRVRGIGTFTPTAAADPHIGQAGRLEHVDEARLESIVREENVAEVLAAIRKAHPYEEPAFDVYPLENKRGEAGLGRWGVLPGPMAAADFIAEVAKKLGTRGIRYVGDATRRVSRVAVCGGAGADLYKEAVAHGCEVYVTGDVKYHAFLDACDDGLILVDAGHAETELPGVRELHRRLGAELPDVEVLLSRSEGGAVSGI
ncbi:MAG: Nif3-like dinuclear metal center hexameric protein [Planctomycetes bacterium]|nr:Nif3-like dinuclear metal center hexameric protein [Planctomycetota bacterium]